ncbi:MAG: hypothetical protein ACKO3R_03525 [bacterium]
MKLNNELDPRRINTQVLFKNLNRNRDFLKIKFSENLQSIYEIPKSFKEASLGKKIFDSESIGNLSSFLGYMFLKVPIQNELEHAMHMQEELRTPFREIAYLISNCIMPVN